MNFDTAKQPSLNGYHEKKLQQETMSQQPLVA